MKQSLKLAQQLVMTPQLQQAIKLLQLSRLELLENLQTELVENPVLEDAPEGEQADNEISGIDLSEEGLDVHVDKAEEPVSDINWENFIDNYFSQEQGDDYSAPSGDDEESGFETYTSKKATLNEHLIWQLRLSNFSFREEQIGVNIIGNLDDDGYLRSTMEEIAADTGAQVSEVEEVLKKIQNFDPVGVGARNLRECLLIQADLWGLKGGTIEKILRDHFPLLEKRDVKGLSKSLKITPDEAQEAIRVISGMEPRPGRAFADDKVQYITPDIYVYKVGDEYVVVLNEDGLPRLRISSYYRSVLKGEGDENDLTKGYIREKLRSAAWLIKSIHQRQRTIYRVTKSIIKFQRDFLDKGFGFLKPLILKDVAEDIGMHESTVSRVTTNKYVHTPQGIFELKFFFNSSVGTTGGGEVAAESVKQSILRLIESEDKFSPMSDQDIVERLKEQQIEIARRTVTKYRESMNILSSSKRRKCY